MRYWRRLKLTVADIYDGMAEACDAIWYSSIVRLAALMYAAYQITSWLKR